MNATKTATLLGFPDFDQSSPEANQEKANWFYRRLFEAGIIDMAPSTKPPGFYVNWTTITGIIALCVFIGSLFVFAWNVAYQQGIKDTETLYLKERLEKAEADAAEAKKFSIYAAAGSDEQNGHKPNQANKEQKK